MPYKAKYAEMRATLKQCRWNVDYVVTHCAPNSIADNIGYDLYRTDALTNFLEEVNKRCEFGYWFFGHYHENHRMQRKHVQLCEQVVELPVQLFENS